MKHVLLRIGLFDQTITKKLSFILLSIDQNRQSMYLLPIKYEVIHAPKYVITVIF